MSYRRHFIKLFIEIPYCSVFMRKYEKQREYVYLSYAAFHRCYFQNYFARITRLKIWLKLKNTSQISYTDYIVQNVLRPAVLGFEVHTYVIFSQSEDDCPVNFCLVNPHQTVVSKFSQYILISRIQETCLTRNLNQLLTKIHSS